MEPLEAQAVAWRNLHSPEPPVLGNRHPLVRRHVEDNARRYGQQKDRIMPDAFEVERAAPDKVKEWVRAASPGGLKRVTGVRAADQVRNRDVRDLFPDRPLRATTQGRGEMLVVEVAGKGRVDGGEP